MMTWRQRFGNTSCCIYFFFIFNWIQRKIDTDFISKSILSIHTNAFFAAGLFITNPFLWDDPKWLNNSNKSMKTKKQWKKQNLLAVLTFFFFSVESLFTTRILQGCSDGRRVIFAHNAAWSHLGRGWEGEGETAADEESRELRSPRS